MLDLRPHQQITAKGRIDSALRRQDCGPVQTQDFEKFQRDLPMFGIFRRDEVLKVLEIQPFRLHLIEKTGKRRGQTRRLGKAARAVVSRLYQAAQEELSTQRIDRRRERQQLFPGTANGEITLQQEFVFFHIADRAHARQHHGPPGRFPQKRLLQSPRRPPSRGEDRNFTQASGAGAMAP